MAGPLAPFSRVSLFWISESFESLDPRPATCVLSECLRDRLPSVHRRKTNDKLYPDSPLNILQYRETTRALQAAGHVA
jgi:hypothetical protein